MSVEKGTPLVIPKMDLFIIHHPNGIQVARGKAPLGSFAVFPGLGKHLSKVLRLLPTTQEGVHDISPCLALTAVGSCIKPAAPEDHIAAFLDCLYPVDKLNAVNPDFVFRLAPDVFGGDYCSTLQKAGVHYLKKDKYDRAFKLVRGGKSSWFSVDFKKSSNLRRLCQQGRDAPSVSSGSSETSEHGRHDMLA